MNVRFDPTQFSKATIVVEGRDDSFDRPFYQWILGDDGINILPLGGYENVQTAANKQGLWASAGAAKIVGVVGREFRSIEVLIALKESCIVTDYFEAESYLCEPDILTQLSDALGRQEPLKQEKVIETIKQMLSNELYYIAGRRTFSRCTGTFGVSVEGKRWAEKLEDASQLREIVRRAANTEGERFNAVMSEHATLNVLDEEVEHGRQILSSSNLPRMLQYLPGKNLLRRLAPLLGVPSELLLQDAISHLKVAKLAKVDALQKAIRQRLR